MTLVLELLSLAHESRIAWRSWKFFIADNTTTNKIRSVFSVALVLVLEVLALHMEDGQSLVVSLLG